MDEPYLGMIALFGFNFAPKGWALCTGQLMSLSQNTALFSLLGTYYGGNGQTNFALPDLQGRAPIGFDQGPGLTYYSLGEKAGVENTSLILQNLPAHTHNISGTTEAGDAASPENAYPANTGAMDKEYKTASNTRVQMNASIVGYAGSNQAVSIMQPYLTMTYCIALEGVFPARK